MTRKKTPGRKCKENLWCIWVKCWLSRERGGLWQKGAGFMGSLEIAWLFSRVKIDKFICWISPEGKSKQVCLFIYPWLDDIFFSYIVGQMSIFLPTALLGLFSILFLEGACQGQEGSLQAAGFNQQEWDVPESSSLPGPASWRTHRSPPGGCPSRPRNRSSASR